MSLQNRSSFGRLRYRAMAGNIHHLKSIFSARPRKVCTKQTLIMGSLVCGDDLFIAAVFCDKKYRGKNSDLYYLPTYLLATITD